MRTLEPVRDADFRSILVDLDDGPIGGVRTCSSNVEAAEHHSIEIDLKENRVVRERRASGGPGASWLTRSQ
jgi:hypothetical protein